MSAQPNRSIDYFRFTECTDRKITVAHRHKAGEVASFCFSDDSWLLLDLLRPHERRNGARIGFSRLPPWLREDAKRYIAHLWKRTEPSALELQQVMVALRDLGRLLPNFKGRPIDLRSRHAREFSRSYGKSDLSGGSFQRTRWMLNRFMAFVREQHPEVKDNDFKVEFPSSKTSRPEHQPLEKAQEAKIETDRLTRIIDACTADLKAYRDAKESYIDRSKNIRAYWARYARELRQRKKMGTPLRKSGPNLSQSLGRAIKGQATILAICVGRRAAAVCNTPYKVKTERVTWVTDAGVLEEGVRVRFRERKIRNVDEDVDCPDVFGELALQAIQTAKELTEELRRLHPEWKDYLFIIPGANNKTAGVLTPRQMNEYLNGQGVYGGIRQRYKIPGGKITTHNYRHTRATSLWLGGLQVHEVAYDLGHASAEMTVRHYIVGKEESRRRLQFLMDHGALSGALEDLVGGREIVRTKLSRRHVEIMKRQGRVLSPTRYGYCALPASSGPCPTGNACYLGPGGTGEGCEHHVLSPDALSALGEDKEATDAVIAECEGDPQYAAWVQNHRNLLVIINRDIDRAKNLQARIDNCGGPETCNCGDQAAPSTGGGG